MTFDLNKIIIAESDELLADIPYKEGIKFKIRYISRVSLTRLSQSCLRMEFNTKSKSREQVVDMDAFAAAFCKRAVIGWSGVTANTLAKLMPVDLKLVSEEERNEPIPFTPAAMLLVLKNTFELDGYLQDAAIEIKNFRPDLEPETKNLNTSQNGVSTPAN
jgi:hypothetical protein